MSRDSLTDQYQNYPYPERNPADESARLVTGSPSDLREVDHFLFGGQRDWSKPFRALVAGGGTGDGLIQLAVRLRDQSCPAEITYIDLSGSSRQIAEDRAAARDLTSITFETGDFRKLTGTFDYIDCCGVLHHLDDPASGFAAIAALLAPGGGAGVMVYAPYGRDGVYPIQTTMRSLAAHLPLDGQIEQVRALLDRLPPSNPFLRNPYLVDHRASDAGLVDLLLNARDRAYDVPGFMGEIRSAGLDLVSFIHPALYDLQRLLPPDLHKTAGRMPLDEAMGLAEQLRGSMKTHIAYLRRASDPDKMADPSDLTLVPHLKGIPADKLSNRVASAGTFQVNVNGVKERVELDPKAAPALALIGKQRTLKKISKELGVRPKEFRQIWSKIHTALSGYNLIHYSTAGQGYQDA